MRKFTLLMSLAAVALFLLSTVSVADDHGYVGVSTCKMCHKKDATGNQYGKWLEGRHAKAYEVLASDEAKEAAVKAGIEGNPQEAAECLSCHVTAAGVKAELLGKKYTVEDGVGCESCHGAGADYKKKSIMEDQAASIAAGMIVPTEETCTACHNEKSPTFAGFDFEEYSAKIAHPIPVAEEG